MPPPATPPPWIACRGLFGIRPCSSTLAAYPPSCSTATARIAAWRTERPLADGCKWQRPRNVDNQLHQAGCLKQSSQPHERGAVQINGRYRCQMPAGKRGSLRRFVRVNFHPSNLLGILKTVQAGIRMLFPQPTQNRASLLPEGCRGMKMTAGNRLKSRRRLGGLSRLVCAVSRFRS